MTDTVRIEEISFEHMDDMLDILAETTLYHLNSFPSYFKNTPREDDVIYLNSVINNPNDFGYAALVDGKAVGLVLFGKRKKQNNCKVSEVYFIYDVAVKNEYKHFGIGRLLCAKVAEKARFDGLRQVELEVFNFNEDAINFYRKQGYRDYSRVMVLDVDGMTAEHKIAAAG